MIRNIVFDMGNVLVRFDPDLFLERIGTAEEDRPLLKREVFKSLEWAQMDRGSLSDEEAVPLMWLSDLSALQRQPPPACLLAARSRQPVF